MLTHEGNLVLQSNTESPSIGDIAYGLGKIVRFAGTCDGWWSVLQHSLVCHDLALKFSKENDYTLKTTTLLALHMLLHDAHECITSDIPTTWKSPEMKLYQTDLDTRIYKSLDLDCPSAHESIIIARLDKEALVSEAYTVFKRFFKFLDQDVSLESKLIVMRIIDLYNGPETTIGKNAPAVIKYKSLVSLYINVITGLKPLRALNPISQGEPLCVA